MNISAQRDVVLPHVMTFHIAEGIVGAVLTCLPIRRTSIRSSSSSQNSKPCYEKPLSAPSRASGIVSHVFSMPSCRTNVPTTSATPDTRTFSTIELAGRDGGDRDLEESAGRHGGEHRTGRRAGRHSTRGLLSRLAGVAAKTWRSSSSPRSINSSAVKSGVDPHQTARSVEQMTAVSG
jgi:hypothetical protein